MEIPKNGPFIFSEIRSHLIFSTFMFVSSWLGFFRGFRLYTTRRTTTQKPTCQAYLQDLQGNEPLYCSTTGAYGGSRQKGHGLLCGLGLWAFLGEVKWALRSASYVKLLTFYKKGGEDNPSPVVRNGVVFFPQIFRRLPENDACPFHTPEKSP